MSGWAYFFIGAALGAAASPAIVRSRGWRHIRFLWIRHVGRRKLVDLLTLFVAALAACFVYLQLEETRLASQNQLRAYVLFESGEFKNDIVSELKFKNVGETPALSVQTSCTMDRIDSSSLDKARSIYYRGSPVGPVASDRGKDQIITFRECDAKPAFKESDAQQYIWAAATYLDIFKRCQHSWVLLKPENGKLVIEYTGTTAPDGACDERNRSKLPLLLAN